MKNTYNDSNFHIFSLIVIIGFINLKVSRILLIIFMGYYLVVFYINSKKMIKNNILEVAHEKFNITHINKNIDIVSLFFIFTLSFICLYQVYIEYNIDSNKSYNIAYTTFDDKETYVVNKNIIFDAINVDVSLISISKIDYGTVVDIVIHNKSNDSIKPTLFNFNIVDNKNNIKYNVPFENYYTIKKGEKKSYTLTIEDFPSDCSDITLEVSYDNFIDYKDKEEVDIELN